jgi:hypothetical protein
LPVRHQQAISTVHLLPVILIRRSTNETDLIVLPIATEARPSKPMGAQFSEESLQECHDCLSLRHGPELGGGIVLKRRVNQFDSPRAHFQLTGVHSETGYRPFEGLLQLRVLRFRLLQDGNICVGVFPGGDLSSDGSRYCGSPTFRTNSANRGSERSGSSKKEVFRCAIQKSRS